jgi:glycosyl transferase family 25
MDNIDAFIYINLDKRVDRREEILSEFKKAGIPEERTYRVSGVECTFGALGCTLAHINALKFAKEKGFKHFIVFEDDFTFVVDSETLNNNLAKFFDLNLDYHVAMLGYNLQKTEPFNELIGYVREAQTASSYLVNGGYTDTLMNCLIDGSRQLAITGKHWIYINDQYWKKLQHEGWYYFMTRIGVQRAGFSDCAGGFRDYGV